MAEGVRPRCGESCDANSCSSRGVSNEPIRFITPLALRQPRLLPLADGSPAAPAAGGAADETSLRSVAPCGRFVRSLDLDGDDGLAVEVAAGGGGIAPGGGSVFTGGGSVFTTIGALPSTRGRFAGGRCDGGTTADRPAGWSASGGIPGWITSDMSGSIDGCITPSAAPHSAFASASVVGDAPETPPSLWPRPRASEGPAAGRGALEAGALSAPCSLPSSCPPPHCGLGTVPMTPCNRDVASSSSPGVFARSMQSRASRPPCAVSERGAVPSVTGKSISCASDDCGFVRSRLLILAASMCVGVPRVERFESPGSGGRPSGKPFGSSPSTSMCAMFSPRRSAEFQWFFTALSVRPGRYLAMSAHLLPNSSCSCMSFRSSSTDHASLRMSWSR
mmetsp:Transcript_9933/g.25658  ORF Transcript_9933/g.25658 Transcript_9933/m.25658 type:complete len:391 (-) Transcript_9933:180-1352(-)